MVLSPPLSDLVNQDDSQLAVDIDKNGELSIELSRISKSILPDSIQEKISQELSKKGKKKLSDPMILPNRFEDHNNVAFVKRVIKSLEALNSSHINVKNLYFEKVKIRGFEITIT